MSRMSPQLAKLSRPRLHRAVLRRRLFRRLDELRAAHAALCVVGPPGAGKTTLVASWLEDRKLPGVWLQVDAGDADAASFFHYLGRAARAFQEKDEPALPALTPEYLADLDGFARRFFRAFFETLPEHAVTVFDNYQEIPAESDLHRLVANAVEEVPTGMLLVVVSRRDPPDCYARLLANERVAPIEWDDIRLTLDEAIELGHARGIRDADLIRRLHTRTDGWAAGLTLLIEHGSRRLDDDIAAQRSRTALFDYFTAEILQRTAPTAREMLARAALFPAVTAEQACRISGQPDAGDVLEDLHRRRLFTDKRVTGETIRYQFHALFRDFLQRRLDAELPADALRALRCEAGALLDGAEDTREEAVALYLDAGEWGAAARTTVSLAPRLMSQGRWSTLRQWIEGIPQGERHDPWLGYWLGMALLNRDLGAARHALTAAFESFRARDDAVGRLLCAAAMIRSYHIEYANFQSMDAWVDAIDALLRQQPVFPSPSAELAVYGAVVLAVTYRVPAHPLREPAVARVRMLLDEPIDPNHRLPAALGLLIYHTLAHEFDKALAVVGRMSPISEVAEVTPINRAYWSLFVGYFHHRRRDRTSAESALERSAQIVSEHGFPAVRFLLGCFRAYLLTSVHQCAEAALAVEGLEEAARHGNTMQVTQYHFARFFIEMCRRNAAGAEHHVRLAVQAAARLGAPFFPVAWLSQGAAALAYNGSYDDAQAWLNEAWRLSEGSFLETYRPMMLASRAFLALRRGDHALAHVSLREMVAQDNSGFGLLYACFPILGTAVFAEALRAGIAVERLREVVRRMDLPGPEDDVPAWPWPVRIYTLGQFRVEIDGIPLSFPHKSPRKPITLLKLLVALGPKAVAERRILDALWPDEEGDAASDALAVATHRLRKLLRHRDVLQHTDGLLQLNRRYVWTDAWAFDAAEGDGPVDVDAADRLFAAYPGDFLREDADASWAVLTRERLRGKFLRRLLRCGEQLERQARHEQAVAFYRRGIEDDALVEELHRGLMRCLLALDRHAEAMSAYRSLRQTLSVALGIAPSPASQQLFREIQHKAQSVPDR